MTYTEWEKKLRSGLKNISNSEKKRTLEYYREMYDEMIAGGKSEDEAVSEFGSPEDCAKQVLNENGKSDISLKERERFSAAEIVGLMFFTLLIVIPLGASALGILVSQGAVSLSGGVMSIAGLLFAVCYPLIGVDGAAMGAGIGLGLATSGVGLLLMVAFLYLTKWFAVLLFKALKAIYVRR